MLLLPVLTPAIDDVTASLVATVTGMISVLSLVITLSLIVVSLVGHPVLCGLEVPASICASQSTDNGLADCESALKRFNGNNQATLFPNLVNIRTIISEFTLLERVIFAAIHPQFDDDLHSSRWRFQTDWKIAMLNSAE